MLFHPSLSKGHEFTEAMLLIQPPFSPCTNKVSNTALHTRPHLPDIPGSVHVLRLPPTLPPSSASPAPYSESSLPDRFSRYITVQVCLLQTGNPQNPISSNFSSLFCPFNHLTYWLPHKHYIKVVPYSVPASQFFSVSLPTVFFHASSCVFCKHTLFFPFRHISVTNSMIICLLLCLKSFPPALAA